MAVAIRSLDWRSEDSLINTQVTQINNLLQGVTLDHVSVADEFLIGFYSATVPANPSKIKVFKLLEEISENGVAATETLINNFISNKTVTQIINLEEGSFLVVYQ